MRPVEVTVLPRYWKHSTLLSFCAIDLDVWLWWEPKGFGGYWHAAGKFLEVCFIQGCNDAVVCKEEVSHKGFKDLGLGLQTSQIEVSAIISVADGDVRRGGEFRKQHSSLVWRHWRLGKTIMERPGEVDKPRWTANLEEYSPRALATDCEPPITYMYIPEVQMSSLWLKV